MSTPRPLLSAWPVTPWAELGIGDARIPLGQARWDVARWDDAEATWAGTEPTWLDVSCEVVDAASSAGRERVIDRFRLGASTVTFRNRDGWADLTGTAVPPALLTLRPGRQLRWGVDTPTGRHRLFRGYVDVADPLYDPYGLDVVTVTAVDALGEVGRIRLPPLDAAVGAGETADVRVARILDAAAWPTTYRDIQPAGTELLGTEMGQAVVDELGITADSTGGATFGDLAGRIVFRNRDWQTYLPTTPPDATIGNVDPADVCPSAWSLTWARSDVAAVARMGRSDGVAVVATDDDALVTIGPEPFERTDLLTAQTADLATLANRVLETRGLDTMPRVVAVTLDATRDPGDGRVVELMATARPETPTRVRCQLVDAGRAVFDRQMFVTDVEHSITNTGRWTCRLGLDVAAPFAAVAGRWDEARWDRAVWIGVAP